MKEMIASKTSTPKDFSYSKRVSITVRVFANGGLFVVLSPISISARLIMTPKPELDHFKVPKIVLSIAVKELGVHIGKYQVISIDGSDYQIGHSKLFVYSIKTSWNS